MLTFHLSAFCNFNYLRVTLKGQTICSWYFCWAFCACCIGHLWADHAALTCGHNLVASDVLMKRCVLCGLSWIWEFIDVSGQLTKPSAIYGEWIISVFENDNFLPFYVWGSEQNPSFFEQKKGNETVFSPSGPWRKAPKLWWRAWYAMSRSWAKQSCICVSPKTDARAYFLGI